jgi:hypothetical protein
MVIPWAQYETDRKGIVISKRLECSFLQLTELAYGEQVLPYINKYNLSDYDFQLICIDEKQQRIVLTILETCFWKKDSEAANFISRKFGSLWKDVGQVIAKTLTESELREALTNPVQQNDFQGYPQTDLSSFQKR